MVSKSKINDKMGTRGTLKDKSGVDRIIVKKQP